MDIDSNKKNVYERKLPLRPGVHAISIILPVKVQPEVKMQRERN